MASDENQLQQYHPTETKIFNGVTYSVMVPIKQSRFTVLIGNGIDAIHESVECDEVLAENHAELYERAHAYAQKLINSGDPRVEAAIKSPGD